MRAYSLGHLHFHVGVPRSANPFVSGIDADRWECGWLDAAEALTAGGVVTR
jgi:hypothetical protein